MSNSFFMFFQRFLILIFILTLFICCICTPLIIDENLLLEDSISDSFFISNAEYIWPSPGYTTINSYFGKRSSPTMGASSFHKGIDIRCTTRSFSCCYYIW